MRSWCTFTSQEQIPDVINARACEIERPNTAPSRSQSYSKLFHIIFPLGSVLGTGLLTALPWPLTEIFFLTFWAQRIWLFRKISASICEQCTSPVWGPLLSPCFLSCQVVASWRNWKGGMTWPDLVSWAMKCFLMPLLFLMVADLHRWVWRWTVYWTLT